MTGSAQATIFGPLDPTPEVTLHDDGHVIIHLLKGEVSLIALIQTPADAQVLIDAGQRAHTLATQYENAAQVARERIDRELERCGARCGKKTCGIKAGHPHGPDDVHVAFDDRGRTVGTWPRMRAEVPA